MKPLTCAIPALLLLAGCATTPTGPSVLVLPGTGKAFAEFNRDEVYCRDYALKSIEGKAPRTVSTDSTAATAAAGTAIGALAGAALGGRDGAAAGAGTGLLFGSIAGSESGRHAGTSTQTRYDNAYIQCMYGAGHRVPVPAGLYGTERRSPAQASGGANAPPPPPPGAPPPPPPGVR